MYGHLSDSITGVPTHKEEISRKWGDIFKKKKKWGEKQRRQWCNQEMSPVCWRSGQIWSSIAGPCNVIRWKSFWLQESVGSICCQHLLPSKVSETEDLPEENTGSPCQPPHQKKKKSPIFPQLKTTRNASSIYCITKATLSSTNLPVEGWPLHLMPLKQWQSCPQWCPRLEIYDHQPPLQATFACPYVPTTSSISSHLNPRNNKPLAVLTRAMTMMTPTNGGSSSGVD